MFFVSRFLSVLVEKLAGDDSDDEDCVDEVMINTEHIDALLSKHCDVVVRRALPCCS